MANEHSQKRILDRLWRTFAAPQTAGIALLALAAIEALRRWQPNDETTLLLRVISVFAIGIGLISVTERWYPRRENVEALGRTGWATVWSFPFFDSEIQETIADKGGRWRITNAMYALAVIGIPTILLLTSLQAQHAGERMLVVGEESVESYMEQWPETRLKRSLGVQLTLLGAGVQQQTPYAQLRVTDVQTLRTTDLTLTGDRARRVRENLLAIKELRPIPGVGSVELAIDGGASSLHQTVTLPANGQVTLSDSSTLHWDDVSTNRFSTLGTAIEIHRERDGKLLERRWLYVDFPALNRRHLAEHPQIQIRQVHPPIAALIAFRSVGGPAWGILGVAGLLVFFVLLLLQQVLPTQRSGRSGDYVILTPNDGKTALKQRVKARDRAWIHPIDEDSQL